MLSFNNLKKLENCFEKLHKQARSIMDECDQLESEMRNIQYGIKEVLQYLPSDKTSLIEENIDLKRGIHRLNRAQDDCEKRNAELLAQHETYQHQLLNQALKIAELEAQIKKLKEDNIQSLYVQM